MAPNKIPNPVDELLQTYSELNSSEIQELQELPSPLEFMRFVAQNIPFVIRSGAGDWPAVRKWNRRYLEDAVGDEVINVAVTPKGNADSPLVLEDNTTIFIKPHEEDENLRDFLDFIVKQETSPSSSSSPTTNIPTTQPAPSSEIRYAQTQNDNLRSEYLALYKDVPASIPFARIALAKSPEAINLWIGNSRSVTALHRDPYENVYVQICGEKHFVLLPGLAWRLVDERWLRSGRYVRNGDGGLRVEMDGDESESVPFACWDPDGSGDGEKVTEGDIRPMRVTLRKGDMLYLPALWYHKVSQSCDKEGMCVAVNYWHDMDYSGHFYASTSFIRNVGLQERHE